MRQTGEAGQVLAETRQAHFSPLRLQAPSDARPLLVRHQMRMSFRYLDLIARFGWPEGAAYNAGPGNRRYQEVERLS
jgi:hypothetical protein